VTSLAFGPLEYFSTNACLSFSWSLQIVNKDSLFAVFSDSVFLYFPFDLSNRSFTRLARYLF
jgi:hypothetical protein